MDTAAQPQTSPSKLSIYAALAGGIAVAAVKFGAFFLSGSAAMLVEGFHSIIDTLNQALLLLGMRLSARPADEQHPFGYGMDSFFWTFVVGMLIFAAGGIASIYEGVEKLRHPALIDHLPLNLSVLAASFVFEIASFVVSWRQSEKIVPKLARRRYRRVTLAMFIHLSPDPGVFEVLAEGAASIIGVVIALAGVVASAVFGLAWADGASAIAIGLLLIALAGVVLAESKSLLTGEAVSPALLAGVRDIISAEPRIKDIRELLSMYLGPNQILLAATLRFQDGLSVREIADTNNALLARLKAAEPRITRFYLRADGN